CQSRDGIASGHLRGDNPLEALMKREGQIAAHELVFGADECLGAAGVTLAGAPTEELAIDAAGCVALRGNHVQTADFANAGAEFDIGAAASHVRSDRDMTSLARQSDNGGFFVEANGIQQPEVD